MGCGLGHVTPKIFDISSKKVQNYCS